jgi:CelD/BcsL family acetyltransferase involved in cellulose biosynthesis
MTAMDPRVVHLSQVDDAFLLRWRALADRCSQPNPCMESDFVLAAGRHVPEVRGVGLLVVEEGDELVGLLPLFPSSRRGALPVLPGIRGAWDGVFLGDPLTARGHEASVAEALLRRLAEGRRTFWLRLLKLEADGPFAVALIAGARHAGMSVQVDAWSRGLAIRRPEATYLAGRGHANLDRLSRQRRAFERSTGPTLEVVDRSADPAAVEAFLVMEAAGWKGRAGSAFLVRPGYADFLRAYCRDMRAHGRLRLWSLQSGDLCLAMKLNLVAGDSLFCDLITFDERYGRLSPGLQLEVENFALFHADTALRVMDSCAGANNAVANRLYPDRRSLVDVNIGAGPVGRLAISLVPAARWASRVAGSRLRRKAARQAGATN